jgi:hypothetical protein
LQADENVYFFTQFNRKQPEHQQHVAMIIQAAAMLLKNY